MPLKNRKDTRLLCFLSVVICRLAISRLEAQQTGQPSTDKSAEALARPKHEMNNGGNPASHYR